MGGDGWGKQVANGTGPPKQGRGNALAVVVCSALGGRAAGIARPVTLAGGGCSVDPAQTTATGRGGQGFFSAAYAFWLAAWDASEPLSRFTRPG